MNHFEKGKNNDVTLILSCPGQKEQVENRPAAGTTGKNLEVILGVLNGQKGISWNRRDITITNSWDKVEYNALTKRTQATKSEVLTQENLERLYREIMDTQKYIVVFGNRASIAINALQKMNFPLIAEIIEAPHLSLQCLNRPKTISIPPRIKKSNTSKQNAMYRLNWVANKIKSQL